MSRTLWLAAGLAALAGGAVALLLLPRLPAPAPAPAVDAREPAAAAPPAFPATPAPLSAPAEIAVDREPLWRETAPASIAPALLPAHREVVPGRALVAFSANLGTLDVGDEMALAVPQLDTVFSVRIEEVHRGPGGARAFTGTLRSQGAIRDHGFVLTVGQRNTFAQFSTPEGSYELVGNNRVGWLMATANMDRDVDYSVPDYRPAPDAPKQPMRLPR